MGNGPWDGTGAHELVYSGLVALQKTVGLEQGDRVEKMINLIVLSPQCREGINELFAAAMERWRQWEAGQHGG